MASSGADALWPRRILRVQAAAASRSGEAPQKGYALLLTTGGMNPCHQGHVALLHQAAARLTSAGYGVLAAWLSPSHDLYLQPKAQRLRTVGLSADFRLELARRATRSDPLVAVGAWECAQEGYWPDFPEVAKNLQQELGAAPELSGLGGITVFYACGTDHFTNCGLEGGMRGGIGVVAVPRTGDKAPRESPDRLVYVAEPAQGAMASFSSTQVRKAIEEKDAGYLEQALSLEAANFLLRPGREELGFFSKDFKKLGFKVPGQMRNVRISLSSILCQFNRGRGEFLDTIEEDDLFFFGSKRSWVFPETEEERQESLAENQQYTQEKNKPVRDLILKKEEMGQVFWLKPPGFVYNGQLYHGDPEAFKKASAWLQSLTDPVTGKPYEPLKLDPVWWLTDFKKEDAKFTSNVKIIVKNFENGAHDYDPVQELLYQSIPTLTPIR